MYVAIGLSTAAYYFIPLCAAILILLTVGRLVVELFQFLKQTYHYFLNWINWMEITLYISTFFFVWLFHAPCWCPQEWQWQSGAVAVFLAWIVLIVFFQKLHLTGVYVLMFTTILVTFLKLTLLALLLVLSFSLSFYMLFETRSVKVIFNANMQNYSCLSRSITQGQQKWFNLETRMAVSVAGARVLEA